MEAERLKKEFEQDLLFLEEARAPSVAMRVNLCITCWHTGLGQRTSEIARGAGGSEADGRSCRSLPQRRRDLDPSLTLMSPVAVTFNVDSVVQHAVKQGERPTKGNVPPSLQHRQNSISWYP